MSIRLLDLVLSIIGLAVGLPILLLLLLVGFLDTGSPLFLQQRVGRHQKLFTLVKFRTMRKETVHTASHLVDAGAITPTGRFLRRVKLDELPQLWNVLKGDMSLVGPRPCLPSQHRLIAEREKLGVYAVRPGITGQAQVRGIDMSTPELLAQTDAAMLQDLRVKTYLCLIIQTVSGKGAGDGVRPER